MQSLKATVFWRMLNWFFLANALYVVALFPGFLFWFEFHWPPQVQTGLLAGANCAMGAWVGYWIDHALFIKLDQRVIGNDNFTTARVVARAIIVGSAMVACNLKLG